MLQSQDLQAFVDTIEFYANRSKVSQGSKNLIKDYLVMNLKIVEDMKQITQIRADFFWEKCDPNNPETLRYFKTLNELKNSIRRMDREITCIKAALKEIKYA